MKFYIMGNTTLVIECAEELLSKGYTLLGIFSKDPLVLRWGKANHRLIEIDDIDMLYQKMTVTACDYLFCILNTCAIDSRFTQFLVKYIIHFYPFFPKQHLNFSTTQSILSNRSGHSISWCVSSANVSEGEILVTKEFLLSSSETTESLNHKCIEMGSKTFPTLLDKLQGKVHFQKNEIHPYDEEVNRAPNCGFIDWNNDAHKIENQFRALSFGELSGFSDYNSLSRLKITINNDIYFFDDFVICNSKSEKNPGTIIKISNNKIIVATNTYDVIFSKLTNLLGDVVPIASLVDTFNLKVDTLLPSKIEKFTTQNYFEKLFGQISFVSSRKHGKNRIQNLFEDQVRNHPKKIAVIYQDEEIDYQTLNKNAELLAQHLLKTYVKKPGIIALCMDKSIQSITAILAILKIGYTYVPIDPKQPMLRIKSILKQLSISLIICDQPSSDKFISLNLPLLKILKKENKLLFEEITTCCNDSHYSSSPMDLNVISENTAYIIFTSGSTGTPKGVPISHGNVIDMLASLENEFNLNHDKVLSGSHSFSFDYSIWEIFGSLLYGGTLVLVSPETARNPELFLKLIVERKISILSLTPSAFSMINNYIKSLSLLPELGVEYLMLAGESINYSVLRSWFQKYDQNNLKIYNLYGTTECTVFSTLKKITLAETRYETRSLIGQPISGISFYILDELMLPTKISNIGEIYIGGKGLTKGYINEFHLNKEKFVINPFSKNSVEPNFLFRTGDMARVLENNEIEYLGRRDNQIKLNGYRIDLKEVEDAILTMPGICDRVVLFDPHKRRIATYLVPEYSEYVYQKIKSSPNYEENHYHAVYENLYEKNMQQYQNDFNIVGWNSSYTLKPLPEKDMFEWVENTIQRIKHFKPKRVLEIGCGTGLLLHRIVSDCEEYCGVDYSEVVINYLSEIIATKNYPHVELITASADEFNKLPSKKYDCIILNSVLVHFADLSYLTNILKYYFDHMLSDEGIIFLGDIRNFENIEEFHASVIAHQNPKVLLPELNNLTYQRIIHDKDLVISPNYFKALNNLIPSVKHVECYMKQGINFNELNLFRYDVVLYKKKPLAPSESIYCHSSEISNFQDIKKQLFSNQGIHVLQNINNKLFSSLNRLHSWMLSDSNLNWDEYNKNGNDLSLNAFYSKELKDLAIECNYRVEFFLGDSNSASNFSAVFISNTIPYDSRRPFDILQFASSNNVSPFELSNEPMKVISSYIENNMVSHLKNRIPSYMIPKQNILLKKIPMTVNGKIDRESLLKYYTKIGLRKSDITSPRNEIEEKLLNIWSQVLNIDPFEISINDDFFELGGDSLTLVKLVIAAEKANFPLKLQQFKEYPTITKQAEFFKMLKNIPSSSDQFSFNHLPLLPYQTSYSVSQGQQLITYLLKPTIRLNRQQVEKTCQLLLERHETLRVQFEYVATAATQNIIAYKKAPILHYVDLGMINDATNSPLELMQTHFEKWILSMDMTSEQCKCQFALFEWNDEQCFFFTIDHMITDLLSLCVFWEDFNALYLGLDLPPIKATYSQLVARYSDIAKQWYSHEEKDYWSHQLSKVKILKPILDMSHSTPDKLIATQSIVIEDLERVIQCISSYQPHGRFTLHDLLLAAYIRSLAVVNDSDDISILLTTHSRLLLEEFTHIMAPLSTIYPLNVPFCKSENLLDTILNLTDILTSIPNHGVGFISALTKIMTEQKPGKNMPYFAMPNVSFNYLGSYEIQNTFWDPFDYRFFRKSYFKFENRLHDYNPFLISAPRLNLICHIIKNNKSMELRFIYSSHFSEKFISELSLMIQKEICNFTNHQGMKSERFVL